MVTGDGNNRSGYSNPRYDALLRAAARELDTSKRLVMLAEAERILLDDSPVIPIYHYSVNDLVKPYVHGIWPTMLDTHPLKGVYIDRAWNKHPTPVAEAFEPGPSVRLAAIRFHLPLEETP
jgi:ABC-type oligopeptide transport system substrate-binding subunit